MLKIAFKNLGCKVNSYELEKIKKDFKENLNFLEVDFKEKADIYIINTCSVTQIADKKSRQMIHKAKEENSLVVAIGCFVDSHIDDLDEKVDLYISNKDKNKTFDIIKNYLENKNIEIKENKTSNISNKNNIRAFIKIEDGCRQFCSYCIIPYLRGEIKSRDEVDILNEINEISKKGIREVVLTGIHLSSYSLDKYHLNYENENAKDIVRENLLNLLIKISKIDDIKRIRFGSMEPRLINEEFVKNLKNLCQNKISNNFLLALQSGSDKTLKNMNRHYTTKDFLEATEILRKYFKNVTIGTDIIVGFPKETEEDFLESLEFAKKIRFYNPNIFRFSKREGTKAFMMENQVDENIKIKRSEIMINELEKITNQIREEYIGKEVEILIEEKKDNIYYGYTNEYMKVKILNESENLLGKIIKKNIKKIENDFLISN